MTIQPAFWAPELGAPPGTAAPAPPPPAPDTPPAPRMVDLVTEYRLLRDRKAELVEAHKVEVAPLQASMQKLEGMMLDLLNQAGSNSMRTDEGTAFKQQRNTYSIDDPHAFRQWVEQQGRPDFYENRVSKDAIDTYIAEGHNLPPGVKASSFVTINVRKGS